MVEELVQLLQQLNNTESDELMPDLMTEEAPPDQDELTSELMARFKYAENWRKQYDERAIDWYKLYVGYVEKKTPGRSNLHIPRTYEEIDALRARFVKSFVAQRPYVDFIPRVSPSMNPEDIADLERRAEIASRLVDYQLDLNNFAAVFYDFVTSVLVFPAGIMGVGWRYEEKKVTRKEPIQIPVINPMTGLPEIDWNKTRPLINPQTGQPFIDPRTMQPVPDPRGKIHFVLQTVGERIVQRPEVTYDDNEIVNIDYFDFFPDPSGRDIDSCRFVFHRERLTRDQIEQKLQKLNEAGFGYVYPIDWDELDNAGDEEEGRFERISSVGLFPETSDGNFNDKSKKLYSVLNYWEDTKYGLIVNSKLVYWGSNLYWRHSKKPFVVRSFEPLPGEFYGLSAVQIIEHLQHELNTHRNQRIDNVSLILNRMFKARRDADLDPAELVSRPHGVIWVEQMDDIDPIIFPDVTASSYTEEGILKQDMENALAVPSVVRGVDSARRETATEVVTKTSNASLRFDVKIMLFEALGFKRLAMLMDLNNQQFIDGTRLIRLVGEDGVEEWRQINQWEIIGEFDYRPAGSNVDPAANKEVRRQQLLNLYQIQKAAPSPYIKEEELVKALIHSFDLRTPEKFLRTDEEVQAMQMQQLQQMMAMQQMAQARQMAQAQQIQQQEEQPQIPPPIQGQGVPHPEEKPSPKQAMMLQQMLGGGVG